MMKRMAYEDMMIKSCPTKSPSRAPQMRSSYGGHGSAEYDERTTCHTKFFTILSSAEKLLEVTLQILKLAGKLVVDKLTIMKVAYLVQRSYFEVHGKHFVDLPFFKYVYGPYNQFLLLALDELVKQGRVEQIGDLEFDISSFSSKLTLSPEVSNAVIAVLNKFKYSFDLVDYTRKLPEVMKTRFGEEIEFEEGA